MSSLSDRMIRRPKNPINDDETLPMNYQAIDRDLLEAQALMRRINLMLGLTGTKRDRAIIARRLKRLEAELVSGDQFDEQV